ncbi:MAG: peptidase domain-containing ABC transporter [Bacteroidales bacterium]|nr:peptidase domain-containing ABC transporter [Bacteroidales bacterium]
MYHSRRKSKLRYVRQRDAMQCGVACLGMVCSAYGYEYSLDTLEKLCTPTKEGVSLKGIADGAAALGLKANGYRITEDELYSIFHQEQKRNGGSSEVAVLHWNQNHFVVVYGISRNGKHYCIADPAKGIYKIGRDQFRDHWGERDTYGKHHGIAMFFEATEDFGKKIAPDGGEASVNKRSWRFLWGYVTHHKQQFVKIAIWLAIGSGLQLLMPFLTQAIVDVGIARRSISIIWLILLGEVVIVAGCTLSDFIRRRLLLRISMHVNISLLSDFFIKLLRLPMSFFDTKLMGDLLQRMGDHSRVENFLTQQTLNVVFTSMSFIILGSVLAVYNWLIFVVFLAGSAIYAAWIAAFLKRRKILDYEQFEAAAKNNGITYQFMTCMQEIKLQGCQQRRRTEWASSQKELFDIQMKSLKLKQMQQAGCLCINELKNILITILAAMGVIDGEITLGAMLAIQFIVGQLNSPVEQLMGFISSIQDVRISLERINQIHNNDNEQNTDGSGCILRTKFNDMPATTSAIEFRDVTFRYDRHSPVPTLNHINLSVPAGKVTAIVGMSGSGKTTLIKLMLGYYKQESGNIILNDVPLREYKLDWWRKQCGVVMQDGVIFSESIERNIATSDEIIDDKRIKYAARIACIDTFIESLPLKYQTKIGRDGNSISQGQKQRILIARAVYRDPQFLFFDEATNSLDAANERMITDNLTEFYRGRTVVVVAHRLSTVRNADNIVVIDNGRIVETGTHESLTAMRGAYFNLVKNQLELGS